MLLHGLQVPPLPRRVAADAAGSNVPEAVSWQELFVYSLNRRLNETKVSLLPCFPVSPRRPKFPNSSA